MAADENNLRHALENNCDDPDCEIHHPDVGIREGTVSFTNLAFFVAGACMAGKAIQDGIESSIEDTINEDFRFYHEEAFNIHPGSFKIVLDRTVETDLLEDR